MNGWLPDDKGGLGYFGVSRDEPPVRWLRPLPPEPWYRRLLAKFRAALRGWRAGE